MLTMWTIYQNPADFPGKFVVRGHDVHAGVTVPHAECFVCDTLGQAREVVPFGLYRMPRQDADQPQIVEVWL